MAQLVNLIPYTNEGLFFLRLVVGIIFIRHGWPKIKNFPASGRHAGLPPVLMLAVGLAETLSGLGLILGVYTQLAALLTGLVMLGAIKMKMINWQTGFVAKNGVGWEFDLTLLAAVLVILLTGGGNIGL